MDYNMPEVAGIDWEKAYHYMPEKEALIEVLKELVKQSHRQSELLSDLRDAVIKDPAPEKFADYRIQAHAMKATLRSIGSDLFDTALSLENAGKEEDLKAITDKTDQFIRDFQAVADKFRDIVGDVEVNKTFDRDLFFEKIAEIKKAMGAFDVTKLQEAFSCVRDMDIPVKYRGQVELLEAAVRDLSADQVEEYCTAIMEQKGL